MPLISMRPDLNTGRPSFAGAGSAKLLMSHSVPASLYASRHHERLGCYPLEIILSLLGIVRRILKYQADDEGRVR